MSMYGKFELQCSRCGAPAIIEQAVNCGLNVGDTITRNTESPSYGECPRCKSYTLVVKKVPPPPVQPPPRGFLRIPRK